MKKTRKKILGLTGLALVTGVTVFAALLPDRGASALETNPITDEVKVRVVGKTPEVTLTSPENGKTYLDPDLFFQFDFLNVDTTTAEVKYTNKDGEQSIYTIDTEDPDYKPGTSEEYPLDLSSERYGYGDYEVVVHGVGFNGLTAEDTVKFSYYPVYGDLKAGSSNGTYVATPYYNEENPDIDSVYANIYDGSGNLIASLSPIDFFESGEGIGFDLAAKGLPSGDYRIDFIAVNEEGEVLYRPYSIEFHYTEIPGGEDEPDLPVPGTSDTGRFVGGLGMSASDIVITSVVAFVAVASVAVCLIIRRAKDRK